VRKGQGEDARESHERLYHHWSKESMSKELADKDN